MMEKKTSCQAIPRARFGSISTPEQSLNRFWQLGSVCYLQETPLQEDPWHSTMAREKAFRLSP